MTTAFDNLSPDRLSRGIYWQRSWNIVLGCSPVSPGCANCWSAREAKRFAAHPNTIISSRYTGLTQGDTWSGVVRPNHAALDIPLGRKKPTVFALWTDLFHEDVPDGFRDQVFARMALGPQHVFLVLTKRPERMLEYFTDVSTARAVRGEVLRRINPHEPLEYIPWPMTNVFLGATAEDQPRLDERAPHLEDLAAAGWRTWLSLEPLLGPVDCGALLSPPEMTGVSHGGLHEHVGGPPLVDWIVAGGETGPGARPMHPDWIRTVRDECVEAEVPFLFKQWGEWGTTRIKMGTGEPAWSYFSDFENYCDKAPTRMVKGDKLICPDGHVPTHGGRVGKTFPMVITTRVGKKRAGRHIDGQTWNSLPNL
jgi:protein gp37